MSDPARPWPAGSWTSDLSVAEHAALRGVGLDPVGLVIGSTVDQLGYAGGGGCGIYGRGGYTRTASGMPVRTPGVAGTGGTSSSPWVGYRSRVQALTATRRRAAQRLARECADLGGDGVVGVHLTSRPFPGAPGTWEYTAVGTAVRARGRAHPPQPFLSDLSGQDVAKLLHRGWVPCGLVFGVAVGVRHDDARTWQATRSWRNAEVPGYTELVQGVRAEVRRNVQADVERHGGTGLVVQDLVLRVCEQECRQVDGASDHVAEAILTGTALTPFRHDASRAPARALQVLRLDQRHARVVGDRLTDPEELR